MFTFTPLLGAQSRSTASQSLLELDGGVKILVDVGWDASFDPRQLKELEKHIPTLSIVLLTHATPNHIAAFAHYCKHYPLFTRIPIYATTPVISLGRTLLQDLYASTPLACTVIPPSAIPNASSRSDSSPRDNHTANILLQPPTPQEIATYFSLVHPLKYSQPHQPLGSPFSPPLNGLTITAYNAGHTLGGTIWHLQHGLESIVYAVDWNQARENVLSGAAWLGGAAGGAEVVEQLRKPTALVCSSRGAEKNAVSGGRKKRDALLIDMIRSSVVKGGTVLIPTDSSARVLELAYLLEHVWRVEGTKQDSETSLKNTKIYLASKNIGATMRYARSMLEWMDESIIRDLEADNAPQSQRQANGYGNKPGKQRNDLHKGGNASGKEAGPFDFQHVRLLERLSQIEKLFVEQPPSEGAQSGKVILASNSSLQWGFSKEILRRIATDNRNLVILTENPGDPNAEGSSDASLGQSLWRSWVDRGDGVAMERGGDGEVLEQVYGGGREIRIQDPRKVPLEGNDLFLYQQYLATERQLQNTLQPSDQAPLTSSADAVDDVSSATSSSSEESDSEQQGKALNISNTLAHATRHKLNLTTEELGINVLLRQKGVYDFDVRGKKGREKMFPFVMKRRRGDEFGDIIRPEEYLKAEERDETDAQDIGMSGSASANPQTPLGLKRKWNDVSLTEQSEGRRLSTGTNKRREKLRPNTDDDDAVLLSTANGTAMGASGQGQESDADRSDEDEDDLASLVPSKIVYSTETTQLNLKIAFLDFTGLHDKRSLQMLIPLIQPRKLILTAGLPEETLSLATDCRKIFDQGFEAGGGAKVEILTPFNGTTVDASVDTNAWLLKLSEPLVRHFRWQNVRGLGVVHVSGMLAADSTAGTDNEALQTQHKRQKVSDAGDSPDAVGEDVADKHGRTIVSPVLDMIPTNMIAGTRSVAQPLHVGDLRLADLRKILQGSGHTAEFRGEGTLLIDGLVAVRKAATGRIEVEGGGLMTSSAFARSRGLEGSFYAVKRKIYEGLAIVASG